MAIRILAILSVCLIYNSVTAQEGESFVDGSKPFLIIEDKNRQAEAWAACAATFEIFSEFYANDKPNVSTQLSQLSNGAELAVTMSMVINEINDDIDHVRFGSVWSYAQLAGSEMPKTYRASFLAQLELANSEEEKEKFFTKLTNTFQICSDNSEGQQFYVDTWRELAKSGLLVTPEE